MESRETRDTEIKLPKGINLTLYLMREELKSRKLFHSLCFIGLKEVYYQPKLDTLILQSMGFDNSAETLRVYNSIMDKYCVKLEIDHDCITWQALKAYYELVAVGVNR